MLNRFILLLLIVFGCSTGLSAAAFHVQDKLYIDADSFKSNTKGDEFYVHVGNNVWLVTHTINRDASGMFAYESSLSKSMTGIKMEYERKWKCPYCYNYWPIGQPCGNKDCPSKYK